MSTIRLTGRTAPAAPSSGFWVYMKTDGNFCSLNSLGEEVRIGPPQSDLSLFVVSQDGDTRYSSVQDAIDAAAAVATELDPKVVFVRPGVYAEDLTFKSHVAVIGANIYTTDLTTTAGVNTTLLGSHVIDADCEVAHIQGCALIAPVSGVPGFSFAATSAACGLVIVDCQFVSLIAKTDVLVEIINDIPSSTVYFENCAFSTRALNEYALYQNADQCETRLYNCRISNGTAPENAILIEDSVGSSTLLMEQCKVLGGVEIAGSGCTVRFDRCDVTETSSSEDLVRILGSTSTVSARYTSFEASSSATYAVSGAGFYTDEGACVYNKTSPLAGTLNAVEFAGKVSYRTVESQTVTVTTTTAVLDQPYPMVLVDTATIGAPSTISLPDAAEYPGYVCTVYDSGGDASSHAITVNSPTSSVSGGASITSNGQSHTYQSTGVFWRRIATS